MDLYFYLLFYSIFHNIYKSCFIIGQININLSATSCFTPNFVNCLYDIIAKYQVPSSFICFELTETEVVYGSELLGN